MGFELRQLVLFNLPNSAMGFHHFDDGLIEQGHAVNINDHVAAIELSDQRDHGFRQRFTLFPIGKYLVESGFGHGHLLNLSLSLILRSCFDILFLEHCRSETVPHFGSTCARALKRVLTFGLA